MTVTAAVDNASETSGDLNKEAWDKYNLLRAAVLVDHDTDGTHLSTGTVVLKALFDANTILAADSDDTPAALTVAASRIIGRASTGNIAALTAAQVNTILSTATKALDNLTAVAINTSLISDTDNTDDLGSATYEWKDLYIDGTAYIDVMAPFTMTGTGAKHIDITGAATTAQINIAGTAILADGEQSIYVNCPSETVATNAVWLTLGSTVTSGDLSGIRSRVTGNATSAGANVRGGYFEAKVGASKKAAMLEGILSHADYSAGGSTISGDVRGFTAHISQGNGLTAANLYGGLVNIQTRGNETVTTDDVGLMVRNEAVGGNGRTMDAGFKLTDLNMGGGTNGFGYGIDLNGVGIGTADIRFNGGQVITSSATTLTLPAFTTSGITASGNLDIGAYTFRCAGLMDDTLTSGRVVFASTNGLLADDADMTFSTDTLTVKKLVLNDATTATTDMLTLTPAGAVATDAIWKGIYINGAALDPSGANAAIEGVYVDLSGVATATGLEMRGVYTSVPAGLDYEAVHSIGKIKLDNDESTLAAGETATGIDVIVLASAAGGGEYHAIDVATTGTSSATLAALGTHTGIDVIHQHTGSFISPTKAWAYDDSGTSYAEVTTEFGSAGSDVTIFDEDNDAIFVGADAAFDEIEVILATAASVDIKPTFWYSKAASFTRFFPADDTEGFTQDGIIRFVGSDLTDFAAQDVEGTSKFYIKIVRTKNNVTTDPIEDTIKTLAATECFWNSTGALQVVSLGAFQATGAIDFNDQNMTSVDIDSGTVGGITLDGGIAGGDQAFTGVGDMTFTDGSILKSGGTNADTLLLAANDTTFITLTTNATDTCAISGAAIDNCIIGAGTAAAGTFVALTATGAISFDGGAFTFNTSEADLDFRVAASSITNALFMQGSDGFVGINEGTPSAPLHITVAAGADPTWLAGTAVILQNNDDAADYARFQIVGGADGGVLMQMGDVDDADEGYLMYRNDTQNLSFAAGANEGLRLSATGVLSVDADGDGTGLVTEFDDYDDARVLQEMCHSASLNRKTRNRELLVKMGIFEKSDETHSGHMMKFQPMVRLLAGGIYQTRDYLERLEHKMTIYERAFERLGISRNELMEVE